MPVTHNQRTNYLNSRYSEKLRVLKPASKKGQREGVTKEKGVKHLLNEMTK